MQRQLGLHRSPCIRGWACHRLLFRRNTQQHQQKSYMSQHHPTKDIPAKIGNMSGAMLKYIVERATPFIKDGLELKLVSAQEKEVVVKMRLKKKFWLKRTHRGESSQTHSGLLAAIIDHAGGFAAWTVLGQQGQLLSTVDLQIDYCNALVPQDIGTDKTTDRLHIQLIYIYLLFYAQVLLERLPLYLTTRS